MAKRRRKKKKSERRYQKKEKKPLFLLPKRTQKLIGGIIVFAILGIVLLSFFGKAGILGRKFIEIFSFLIGNTIYAFPLFLFLAGIIFLKTEYKKFLGPLVLAIFILILGLSGILAVLEPENKGGGIIGYVLSLPLLKLIGLWATQIIFLALVAIGALILWQLLRPQILPEEKKEVKEKKGVITQVLGRARAPKFKLKEIHPSKPQKLKEEEKLLELKVDKVSQKPIFTEYKSPPINLLEDAEEKPSAGDTKAQALTIKKTLENFGIPVEIAEINIGPTVTQYALKPAEGIKLSKITALTNNLALALAAHPIRIEAPIPGRSLVGIEVPNKVRARVRLKNLIFNPIFKSSSNLTFALGKDVSGAPVYADLAKMPHLLVAGATGTGKTCKADTLIVSEKGLLTFEELCPLPLNSEANFEIKVVSRDGIETTKKIYNNGICQFYKITTRRGYQIEVTAEHPLWVMNKDGSQSWKQACLIKKGDYVAISRGPALFGNKIDLSDFKPSRAWGTTKRISFPDKMTPKLAQFLGLLSADGGLSVEKKGTHRVVYTQANPKLLSLYKKLLRELFGITQFIEKKSGSNPNTKAKDIVVNSIQLKEFLNYLGVKSVKSPQKEIPRAIREAPKEIVASYLRALFDNDGHTEEDSIELSLSSKKLLSQVQIMLLNFGIISSLKLKKVKNYPQNDYFRLSLYGEDARKFIKKIGFLREEKYQRLKKLLESPTGTNVDVVPHLSSLLKNLAKKYRGRFARLTNKGWKYQSGILIPKYAFNSLRSYNSGERNPSYRTLMRILGFYQPISQEPEYQQLEKIYQRNFYYDRVEKIERTLGVGYDFFVPGSDSFVGNGFVNHNTIFLNSLILSLLYKNGPDILRLILVDPKRVEFSAYNKLPHLIGSVIHDAPKTVICLNWLVSEMERRFEVLSEERVRDIEGLNEKILKEGRRDFMPYIIFIVDELADLILAKGKEIESGIVRLAQLARAVGIHLVLATQRPSVEVITGLIKANITSRVSFQVASQVDSRTILDMAGAEKLLGLGDMLFLSAQTVKPRRIQGAYVSEKEFKRVVDWICESNKDIMEEDELSEELEEVFEKGIAAFGEGAQIPKIESGIEDALYPEAKRLVIESKRASASFLQRKLKIGYARAARLIDMLEERGIVGPPRGSKPRIVYGEEGGVIEDDEEISEVDDFGRDYDEEIT